MVFNGFFFSIKSKSIKICLKLDCRVKHFDRIILILDHFFFCICLTSKCFQILDSFQCSFFKAKSEQILKQSRHVIHHTTNSIAINIQDRLNVYNRRCRSKESEICISIRFDFREYNVIVFRFVLNSLFLVSNFLGKKKFL